MPASTGPSARPRPPRPAGRRRIQGGPACEVLEWKLDIATATVLDMGAHTRRALGRIARQKAEHERGMREWRLKELERKEQEIAAERKRLAGGHS